MGMLKSRTYIVPGDPIPLQRARSNARGRPWDPQKVEKNHFIAYVEEQHDDMPLYTVPVIFEVTFNFRVPQTYEKMMGEMIGRPHKCRPDLSNLVKFAEDCLQGILFRDDCIIYKIRAHKVYAVSASTEFTLIPLV
jgi:Holliday junction resolvase RusA-like endonuclease